MLGSSNCVSGRSNDKADSMNENDGNGTQDCNSENTAPNLITNGHCNACNTNVNVESHGVKCWFCKNFFHAVNCESDKNCVSAPTVFQNQLLPAMNKSGVYEKRFGHFLFACDFCMTNEEAKIASATVDRVNILDKKIDSMRETFKTEINELKSLMVNKSSNLIEHKAAENTVTNSVWNDKQRTENLKHMLAIKKDKDGNALCSNKLEKLCVDNGISVHNTFTLKKSTDTGVVLNSKNDADKLKEKILNSCPEHKIEKVATKVPSINVVGLAREYSKEEVLTMVKNQNPSITSLLESSTSPEDKILEVTYIAPLKNNSNLFRASIRVSNVIRSAISKQNDRIFVGSHTCKVYDSVFTLRCYNCQEYGHHSKDCKNEANCGFCAEKHETRSCGYSLAEDPMLSSCINCIRAKHEDHKHEANCFTCPVYLENYEKAKKNIPFYQRN